MSESPPPTRPVERQVTADHAGPVGTNPVLASTVLATVAAASAAFEIDTQRLLLRPVRHADVAAITELAADPAVASMTARIPHPYSEADARAFVEGAEAVAAGGADPLFGPLSIVRRADGAFLGCIGLTPRPRGVAEIGYWIGRPHWGQGFATEAARALIDYAFSIGGVAAVEGSARVINDASRRVLERCGLRYVNSGLAPAPARGGALPVDHFRLCRRDWDSLKAWRPASVRTLSRPVPQMDLAIPVAVLIGAPRQLHA